MKIYYTFGTDSHFPHRGGWVEVEADSVQQAHALFRAKYPDRTPGILNCSDYYTEDTFKKSEMSRSGNLGAFCHEVLALKTVYGYADNSVEEVYVDKDDVEKRVMVVVPHGDAC